MRLLDEENTSELQNTNEQTNRLNQEIKVSDLSNFDVEKSESSKNHENDLSNSTHVDKKEAAKTSAAPNNLSTPSFDPTGYNEILDFNFLFNTVTNKAKKQKNGTTNGHGHKNGLEQKSNGDQNYAYEEGEGTKNMTTHGAIIASLQKLKINSNEKLIGKPEQKTAKPKTKKTLSKMTEVERNNYLLFGSDYGEDFSEDDLGEDYAEMSSGDEDKNDKPESKAVELIHFDNEASKEGAENNDSNENTTSEITNLGSGSEEKVSDKTDSEKAIVNGSDLFVSSCSNQNKTASKKNKACVSTKSCNDLANPAKSVKLPENEFPVSENFLCLYQQSCQFKAVNSELQVRKISNSVAHNTSVLKHRSPFSNGQKIQLNVTIYRESCVKIGITATNLVDYDVIQENRHTRLLEIRGGNCSFSGISQNRSLGVFHCSVEAEMRDDVMSFYDVTTADRSKLFEVSEIQGSDWMFVAICHGNVDIS